MRGTKPIWGVRNGLRAKDVFELAASHAGFFSDTRVARLLAD